MKKSFENWLINAACKNSGLSLTDINTEKRTINLGLWGLALSFMEPRHKLCGWLLVKLYKYKLMQTEFVITSTWCNTNIDDINKRFFAFNDEFNNRKGLKQT